MANMYAGYQGPSIYDDVLGLVYWNAAEQQYEKRTGYFNENGALSFSLDGQNGGYDLPKNWFNDKYNALTGKYGNSPWPIIAALSVIGLIAYIIFRKK